MQTIERIHDVLRAAKEATDTDSCKIHLLRARTILAEAVVAGESPDRRRLEQLAILAGSQARRSLQGHRHDADSRRGIAWVGVLNSISDYLESGGVPLPDGRVATADGWNTKNCPPPGVQLFGN